MLLSLFALSAPARAWESPEAPVLLQDQAQVFAPVAYDSGWLPSGSPVQLDFHVDAEGGASVEMQGASTLTWPEALTHAWSPWEGTGLFLLDSDLVASVDIAFDVFGTTYQGTLASTSVSFSGRQPFDPWLLPGGGSTRVEASGDGAATELFDLDYEVLSGVSVYLQTQMRPHASAGFEGLRFTTGGSVIDQAGADELFDPPQDVGSLGLEGVFTGWYDGLLSLVLTPTVGVCVDYVGCYDLASFDIDVPLAESGFEQDFAPVEVVHPLPVLEVDEAPIDFGDVELGDDATVELPLANAGDLLLEGQATIIGTGEFTAFPQEILAAAGGSDGVVVTFAPTVEGDQEATLVLSTSDPSRPDLEIPLSGTGTPPPAGDTGSNPVVSTESTCGCAQAGGRPASAWLALLAPMLLLRRRGYQGRGSTRAGPSASQADRAEASSG